MSLQPSMSSSLPRQYHNTYLSYKHNTSRLLRWIVTTASSIPSSEPIPATPAGNKSKKKAASRSPSDSPIVKISQIPSLCQHISARPPPPPVIEIPSTVYELFQSVINARTAAYRFFVDLENVSGPSGQAGGEPGMRESNQRHKAFIDALEEGFRLLGGEEWKAQSETPTSTESEEKKAISNTAEELLEIANRFQYLTVDEIPEAAEELGSDFGKENNIPGDPENEWLKDIMPQHQGSKAGCRRIKGSRNKNKKHAQVPEEAEGDGWKLENVRRHKLDQYRVEDDSEEALFAGLCFLKDLGELRRYNAKVWSGVAIGEISVMTASILSDLSIGIARQLEYDLSASFETLSSYERITAAVMPELWMSAVSSSKSGPGLKDKIHSAKSEIELHQIIAGYKSFADSLIDVMDDMLYPTYGTLHLFLRFMEQNLDIKDMRWCLQQDLSRHGREMMVNEQATFLLFYLKELTQMMLALFMASEGTENQQNSKILLWGHQKFARELTVMQIDVGNDADNDADKEKLEIKPSMILTCQILVDAMHAQRQHSHPSGRLGERLGEDLKKLRQYKKQLIKDLKIAYLEDNPNIHEEKMQQQVSEINSVLRSFETGFGGEMTENVTGFKFVGMNADTNKERARDSIWSYNPWLCGSAMVEVVTWSFESGFHLWNYTGFPIASLHLYNILLENEHCPSITFLEEIIQIFRDAMFIGGRRPTVRDQRGFLQAWGLVTVAKAEVFARNPRKAKGGEVANSVKSNAMKGGRTNDPKEWGKVGTIVRAEFLPDKIPDSIFPSNSATSSSIPSVSHTPTRRSKTPTQPPPNWEAIDRTPHLSPHFEYLARIERISNVDLFGSPTSYPVTGLNMWKIHRFFVGLMRNIYEEIKDTSVVQNAKPQDRVLDEGMLPDKVMAYCLDPVMKMDIERVRLDSEILRRAGKVVERMAMNEKLADYRADLE
ncbi:hypothetical protein RUND412_003053 [Rhizina undulata]